MNISFEYIEDFANHIVDRVEDDEDLFLTVIGKFDEIKSVLGEIFICADVDFENLNIQSSEVNGYTDEYVLDCWCDDGIVQIGCEPAIRNGKYLNLGGDEIYLFDNCSSSIIPLCEESDLYFVSTEDDCICDEECDECCPCACHNDDICEERDDIHGFAVSKEDNGKHYDFYYYTSDALDEKDICSILKEFGF